MAKPGLTVSASVAPSKLVKAPPPWWRVVIASVPLVITVGPVYVFAPLRVTR